MCFLPGIGGGASKVLADPVGILPEKARNIIANPLGKQPESDPEPTPVAAPVPVAPSPMFSLNVDDAGSPSTIKMVR